MSDVYQAAWEIRDWLDFHNGTDQLELANRIMKVGEEFGEAVQAWIGYTGQNPRKGETHDLKDVVDELADVALSALVAIDSVGGDSQGAMARCTQRVLGRLEGDK